ncbi:hypothetical protein [Kineococcus esterisolvens]|uniref:hypothetical protein n=1 Tax=unclassified Kineococcus TaxID=2621656 RepID=UPI003D7D38AF
MKRLTEFAPVEDFMLALLRRALPDISVQSLIWDEPVFPFILVRRGSGLGVYNSDHRFLDSAMVEVHTFTQDPDGDEDGAILSEAVRVSIFRALDEQQVFPSLGHLTKVEIDLPPRRVTDWATASGPVQYADLPAGVWRYQTTYRVEIRKPRRAPSALTIPTT